MPRYMGFQTLSLPGVLLAASVSFGAATIDPPANFDPPEKEEGGILTTLVSTYSSAREAVKYVYDEIIYFEHMYTTYEKLNRWFETNKVNVADAWDASTRLATDPQDIFTTLQRMEKVFDKIDNLVLNEPRRLDYILAGGEYWWDAAATRNNEYTGMIAPRTNEVLEYIEAFFLSNAGKPLTADQASRMTSKQIEAYARAMEARARLAGIKKEEWPEERLRAASVLIASSALAQSGAYRKWAITANHHVQDLDGKLQNLKGVNAKEMAAAWMGLENVNASNKALRHSLEELKVMSALLGYDNYDLSKRRADGIQLRNQMRDFQFSIRDAGP